MVENIPAQVFAAKYNDSYFAVEAISEDGVTIRFSEKIVVKDESISLSFLSYNWDAKNFEESKVFDARIKAVVEREFDYEIIIQISDEAFISLTNRVINQYYKYIKYRLSLLEGEDEKICQSYQCFLDNKQNIIDGFSFPDGVELAIELDNHRAYEKFLREDIDRSFTRIYIGNAFCHNLKPEPEQLMAILKKAVEKNIAVTYVTTYLRSEILEDFEYLFRLMDGYEVEIELNDIGWIKYFEEKSYSFSFSIGRLINKRRQDPRISDLLHKENALNDESYICFFRDKGISRAELEACGYEIEIPQIRCSLHFPFYHTNISQNCTLYALIKNNDRGKQSFVKSCPHYCEKYHVTYPASMDLVGRYNGLFGFDSLLLKDASLLTAYMKNGVDRIVWNMEL